MRRFVLTVAVLCCASARVVQAGPGDVDPGFDAGSVAYFAGVAELHGVVVEPDGQILIGGFITSVDGTSRTGLARLNADGSLDTSFVPGYAASPSGDTVVWKLALQGDGKVVVAGRGLTVADKPCSVVRLLPDGALDPTFTLLSIALYGGRGVEGLALQPDGRILIGGDFNTVGGTSRLAVARLNADGTLDTSFDVGLQPPNLFGRPESFVPLADGRILAGGNWVVTVGGTTIRSLVRLEANGVPDPSFDPAIETNAVVHALDVAGDGSISVGGDFTSVGGSARVAVAHLTADGALDASFANPNFVLHDRIFALRRQGDGHLLIGGEFGNPVGCVRCNVARLDTSGLFDTFSPPGGANRPVYAAAIQADGAVLIAGAFTRVGGVNRQSIARLYAAAPDADVAPPVLHLPAPITAEATSPSGAPVSYAASAEDAVDGPVAVSCTPASGSTFGFGTTGVVCSAADAAGNTATGSFDVTVVDTTAPIVTATAGAGGAAYVPGTWANVDVTVTFTCVDGGSGVAGLSAPVTLGSDGTAQAANGSCVDGAGNVANVSFTNVWIDKTPPGLSVVFDVLTREPALFARDALSGVAAGSVTPLAVTGSVWTPDDDLLGRDPAPAGVPAPRVELRTYRVSDAAGNQTTLALKLRRSRGLILARVMGLPRNTLRFAWTTKPGGALRALAQTIALAARNRIKQRVDASYDARVDNTRIVRAVPAPPVIEDRPGLVLLGATTAAGRLVIEF